MTKTINGHLIFYKFLLKIMAVYYCYNNKNHPKVAFHNLGKIYNKLGLPCAGSVALAACAAATLMPKALATPSP